MKSGRLGVWLVLGCRHPLNEEWMPALKRPSIKKRLPEPPGPATGDFGSGDSILVIRGKKKIRKPNVELMERAEAFRKRNVI